MSTPKIPATSFESDQDEVSFASDQGESSSVPDPNELVVWSCPLILLFVHCNHIDNSLFARDQSPTDLITVIKSVTFDRFTHSIYHLLRSNTASLYVSLPSSYATPLYFISLHWPCHQ